MLRPIPPTNPGVRVAVVVVGVGTRGLGGGDQPVLRDHGQVGAGRRLWTCRRTSQRSPRRCGGCPWPAACRPRPRRDSPDGQRQVGRHAIPCKLPHAVEHPIANQPGVGGVAVQGRKPAGARLLDHPRRDRSPQRHGHRRIAGQRARQGVAQRDLLRCRRRLWGASASSAMAGKEGTATDERATTIAPATAPDARLAGRATQSSNLIRPLYSRRRRSERAQSGHFAGDGGSARHQAVVHGAPAPAVPARPARPGAASGPYAARWRPADQRLRRLGPGVVGEHERRPVDRDQHLGAEARVRLQRAPRGRGGCRPRPG